MFGGLKPLTRRHASDTSLSYSIGENNRSKKAVDRAFEKLFTVDESSFLGEVRVWLVIGSRAALQS